MIRTFALLSTLVAASLSTSALAAQSSATTTQQPAAAPTTKHAPAVHAKADTSAKTGVTAKATTTRHAAWTKDQIMEAQEGLTKAGFYKGKATGVFNKETRKALRAYQKQNKMPVTGRLSDSVLVKLKSA